MTTTSTEPTLKPGDKVWTYDEKGVREATVERAVPVHDSYLVVVGGLSRNSACFLTKEEATTAYKAALTAKLTCDLRGLDDEIADLEAERTALHAAIKRLSSLAPAEVSMQ